MNNEQYSDIHSRLSDIEKEIKFDIVLTRIEVLFLLKPDENDRSISDENKICIMCKEYGDDDDWVGLCLDDYETILEDASTYKTFQIWLSGNQKKDEICRFIKELNIPEDALEPKGRNKS